MIIDHEEFTCQQAIAANRLIDYYEGRQLNYVRKALDGELDYGAGRRYNWQTRGYTPRMRNIVKPIVDKSAGMLFTKAPLYTILPNYSPTAAPVIDARFNELLALADFQEVAYNWNNYSRLLRSLCILQQKVIGTERITEGGVYRFDGDSGDTLVITLLHRGNSVVHMNAARTTIIELAYLTAGTPSEEEWAYRVIRPLEIIDVVVKNGEEYPVSTTNLEGFVPATMHYDTNKPRCGAWQHIPEDIRSIQELVNTHLTDIEFALASQKQQPLYTDAKIVRPDEQFLDPARVGEKVGALSDRTQSVRDKPDIGGIGSIVYLEPKRDGTAPFIDHKGPAVNLLEQQQVINSLIVAVADDWSVNMKIGGEGGATSGFQLIVEEIDNLVLREQRQNAFVGSLRRFYDITKRLYPELTDGALQVEFRAAALPVNQKEVEEIWASKIEGGRASRVDYLMTVEGLTLEEAILRNIDIQKLNTAN